MSQAPDHFVPRHPTAQEAPCAEPAAPAAPKPTPAGAAFFHFTESGCVGARETDGARPAEHPSAAGRAVTLSDHSLILLRAIASFERCSNDQAIALALAAYATTIGAGPLARAVLDELERVARPGRDDIADDLHDLPQFERRDRNRFSRAREAAGDRR